MTTGCKDCLTEGVPTRRPVHPDSGPRSPRCTTHYRAWKKRAAQQAHGRKIVSGYGMTLEQYSVLYAAQGGHCAICQVATGKARRLAVDHDHKICNDHPPEKGCPRCWRGLLCKRCNQLVGWYDVQALARAIRYISDPPARRLLCPAQV